MDAHDAEKTEFLVRFFHPVKLCAALPGAATLTSDDHARLYGLDAARYEEVLSGLRRDRRSAVDAIVERLGAERVRDGLPFREGDRVLAFGDSITDDLLSWAELLRDLLARLVPERDVAVVNGGVSGETTAQGVARFLPAVEERPDWIIFMLGTNDARRHGANATRSQLALAETLTNLSWLRQTAKERTQARLVWMTPPPVLEDRFADHWMMGPQEAWYTNRDLRDIVGAVSEQGDLQVDLWRHFQLRMDEPLYLSDGLHPSVLGQRLILEALLAAISAGSREGAP